MLLIVSLAIGVSCDAYEVNVIGGLKDNELLHTALKEQNSNTMRDELYKAHTTVRRDWLDHEVRTGNIFVIYSLLKENAESYFYGGDKHALSNSMALVILLELFTKMAIATAKKSDALVHVWNDIMFKKIHQYFYDIVCDTLTVKQIIENNPELYASALAKVKKNFPKEYDFCEGLQPPFAVAGIAWSGYVSKSIGWVTPNEKMRELFLDYVLHTENPVVRQTTTEQQIEDTKAAIRSLRLKVWEEVMAVHERKIGELHQRNFQLIN